MYGRAPEHRLHLIPAPAAPLDPGKGRSPWSRPRVVGRREKRREEWHGDAGVAAYPGAVPPADSPDTRLFEAAPWLLPVRPRAGAACPLAPTALLDAQPLPSLGAACPCVTAATAALVRRCPLQRRSPAVRNEGGGRGQGQSGAKRWAGRAWGVGSLEGRSGGRRARTTEGGVEGNRGKRGAGLDTGTGHGTGTCRDGLRGGHLGVRAAPGGAVVVRGSASWRSRKGSFSGAALARVEERTRARPTRCGCSQRPSDTMGAV